MSNKGLRPRYHQYYFRGKKETVPTPIDKLIGRRYAFQYFNETGRIPTIDNFRNFMGFSHNDIIEHSFNETAEYMFNRYKAGLPILSGMDHVFLNEEKEWSSIPESYVTKINKAISRAKRNPKAPRFGPGIIEDTMQLLAPAGAAIFAGSLGAMAGNPLLGIGVKAVAKDQADKYLDKGLKDLKRPNIVGDTSNLDAQIEKTANEIYSGSTFTMNEAKQIAELGTLANIGSKIVSRAIEPRSNSNSAPAPPAGASAFPIGNAHTAYIFNNRSFNYNGRKYRRYNNKFGYNRTRRFRYRNRKIYKKYNKRYRRYRRHYI